MPLVKISLDDHSAMIVRYALSQRLKIVRQELEILKIAKERDLTSWERYMLPSSLQLADKNILLENTEPWESLVFYIEETLKDLEKAFEVFDKEKNEYMLRLSDKRRK
jgi:hypothetical protein